MLVPQGPAPSLARGGDLDPRDCKIIGIRVVSGEVSAKPGTVALVLILDPRRVFREIRIRSVSREVDVVFPFALVQV